MRKSTGTRTPETLSAAVDDAIALSDNVAGEIKSRDIPDLERIACAHGCAWCCYYQVGVTAPHALRIAAYVASGAAALPAASLIERLRRLDVRTHGLGAAQRLRERLPCAFLENMSCTIYDIRPFGCRGANSVDADFCRASLDGTAGQKPQNEHWLHKVPYEAQRDLQDGFHRGALDAGLRDDRLELTAAIIVALETPDAAQRWIDGEDIFKDARLPKGS